MGTNGQGTHTLKIPVIVLPPWILLLVRVTFAPGSAVSKLRVFTETMALRVLVLWTLGVTLTTREVGVTAGSGAV